MKIVISGGGTGGHIYPALALIREIQKRNPETEFLYVGTENGLESKIIPAASVPFKTIKIQGFRRSLSMKNFKTVYLFFKSIQTAKKILREFQPDVVLGTGGYVSSAVVYAAKQLKIPSMIHEQNSVPGLTNKFLARYVDRIGICFEAAAEYFPKEKTVLTGNPRAQEVCQFAGENQLATYGLDPNQPTVLIFGGSRGAATFNKALLEALELIKEQPDYQILYVSGERYFSQIKEQVDLAALKDKKVVIVPYIDQMEAILQHITLIVSRAGATTIAEITALGLPSVLVPSPNVTNDHQTKNAQSLVTANAAKMISDQELNGERLVKILDELFANPTELEKMKQAAKKQGMPKAAENVFNELQAIAKQK